ncbi:hypothetical protein [Bacillus cereus]|nr:hypothetical protein [Bacillus cereus]
MKAKIVNTIVFAREGMEITGILIRKYEQFTSLLAAIFHRIERL